MTTKPEPKRTAAAFPTELAEVALIDAEACAAVGSMSVSWWHAEVAAGRAPAPAIRQPRCTRWRLSDAMTFWRDRANEGTAGVSYAVMARAQKASAAALVKRKAATAMTSEGGQ